MRVGNARKQCCKGSVMVVKHLGACWTCDGAVLRKDRDGSEGAWCICGSALEQCYEGTVMVVKDLGARWKCAGTGLRRNGHGSEGRCILNVRWSSVTKGP